MRALIDRFERWLRADELSELNPGASPLVKRIVRFFVLLWENVMEDRLTRTASSLTYTTILSIFPLLVLLIATASFFFTPDRQEQFVGFIQMRLYPGDTAEDVYGPTLPGQEERGENIRKLRDFVTQSVTSFRDKAAGIGFAGFIGMVIAAGLLYNAIEDAFDSIWSRGRKRSLKRTATTFLSLLVLAPVLVGASLAFSTLVVSVGGEPSPPPPGTVETAVTAATAAGDLTQSTVAVFAKAYGKLLTFLPIAVNVLFLTMAYVFVPQATVRWKPAFVGALVASCLWELTKLGFAKYVFMSSIRRQLFQSLGAVPIFLIWLYVSWLVFLAGNEIAYILQNFRRLCVDRFWEPNRTPVDGKLLVAVMTIVCRRFAEGKGPTPFEPILHGIGIRLQEAERLVERLVSSGFLVVSTKDGYVPARPAETIPVAEVIKAGCDVSRLPFALSETGGRDVSLLRLQEDTLGAVSGRTMADLIGTAPAKGA